jgi:RHS repeat-associated protein
VHKQRLGRGRYRAGAYKYKYNGKELQDENIGGSQLNWYDYGNRNYDASIGRFHNMDRFAEKYYHLNPYQYGANNPILYNDIKGDSILIYSEQDKGYVKYENGNLYSRNGNKWQAYNGKNVKVDKNGKQTIGGFLGKTASALDKIRNGKGGNELVTAIQNDKKYDIISESSGDNSSGGVTGGVHWNPFNTSGGPDENGSTTRDSYIGLAHELGHVMDGLDGIVDNTLLNPEGGTVSDYQAMHWENRVRGENGLSLRPRYGNDSNGNVIGQALNPNGTSNRYLQQQQTIPTVQLHAQFSSSGMNIVPISTTTTTVIPFQYK